jgi:hypothetical protein
VSTLLSTLAVSLITGIQLELSVASLPESILRSVNALHKAGEPTAQSKTTPSPLVMVYLRSQTNAGTARNKVTYTNWLPVYNQATVKRASKVSFAEPEQIRIDLLLECVGLDLDREIRIQMINTLFRFIKVVDTTNRENRFLSKYDPDKRMPFSKSFEKLPDLAKLQSARDIVIPSYGVGFQILMAESLDSSARGYIGSLVCSSLAFRETGRYPGWSDSILLTNAAMKSVGTGSISQSLWIVDSDLELTNIGRFEDSILISNGTLKIASQVRLSGSYIYSTGKISISKEARITNTKFFSKFDIDMPDGIKVEHWNIREPFGIRFFQLSDVGIAAKTHAKGAEITAVSPFSPLRLFGLRVGDVVTKVDDRTVDSPDALRRATRTAYVREAGVYHLLRNGQAIDRIVLFGDYQLPK